MLSITRKPNETVVLRTAEGIEIVLRVASVKGRVVRMDLDAPREVEIRWSTIQD